MTTKEQERKALEKIRQIVESLGENSYIGMAFEGCFEKAEENIENDFGLSMKQEVETLEEKLAKETARADDCDGAYKRLKERYDKQEEIHSLAIEKMKTLMNETSENLYKAYEGFNKEREKAEGMEKQIKQQEQTIIELKAKLYDLITAK